MILRVLVVSLFAVFSLLVGAAPVAAQGCQLHSGLTYGTYVDSSGATRPLRLDLMRPTAAAGDRPLVIWIHGGGWRTGSYTPIPSRVTALCERGFAVASVQYRLSGVAKWPAQIHDVRGAIRWLRRHAATYDLDPWRFAAWGNSAGGHLAAFVATSGGVKSVTVGNVTLDLEGTTGGNLTYSSRVQAAVDWYGITDFMQQRFYPLTRNPDASTSYEGDLLGGSVQTRPELAETANPVAYASADDPPMLVMHGTLDGTVPLNQSELLVDALQQHGVHVDFRVLFGASHSVAPFDSSANRGVVYAFIAAALRDPLTPPAPAAPPAPVPGGISIRAVDAIAMEPSDTGRLQVTRGGDLSASVGVFYEVSGTAIPGQDYALLAGWVTIPAGASSAIITVSPFDDDNRESAETVIVSLMPGSGYAVGAPRAASVALRDNDSGARPMVSVSAPSRAASERGDTGTFIVSRTGSTVDPLTVSLEVSGTAMTGVDYAELPRTVTFPSGSNRMSLLVTPRTDSTTEDPETVVLRVLPQPSIYVGPYVASVAITDYVLPPPAPGWRSDDIGSVGVTGSVTLTDGTYTVKGAGADIWGTADGFHFVSQALSGDGEIVARVTSVNGPHAWTKVGVMMRASTSASSRHASMFVSRSNGLAFQRRRVEGGTSVHTSGGSGSAPHWVRLARAGDNDDVSDAPRR